MPASSHKPQKLLATLALIGLVGCDSEATPTAAVGPSAPATMASASAAPVSSLATGFAPIAYDLQGTSWLVTAIDGGGVAERYNDLVTIHFTDTMVYWQGCNQHEALYMPMNVSFVLGRTVSTQADCPSESPDGVVSKILTSKPLIGRNREGHIMLANDEHGLVLSQIDTAFKDPPLPPADGAIFALQTEGSPASWPLLKLAQGRFSVWMDCPAAIRGQARVRESQLVTSGVRTGRCESHRPTAIGALAEFLQADPAFALGVNGDLLMSDGSTVISGRRCAPGAPDCRRTVVRD